MFSYCLLCVSFRTKSKFFAEVVFIMSEICDTRSADSALVAIDVPAELFIIMSCGMWANTYLTPVGYLAGACRAEFVIYSSPDPSVLHVVLSVSFVIAWVPG